MMKFPANFGHTEKYESVDISDQLYFRHTRPSRTCTIITTTLRYFDFEERSFNFKFIMDRRIIALCGAYIKF